MCSHKGKFDVLSSMSLLCGVPADNQASFMEQNLTGEVLEQKLI